MATKVRGMPATPGSATEDDLLRTPDDGYKYELVDGQIRMSPAGSRHGLVSVNLVRILAAFVVSRKLGYVFDSSTGFRMPGGNVRSPDVSFVAFGRFTDELVPEGFSPVPPDLAVEILSPDDRPRYVLDKVGEYLGAGVRLVWIVDPRTRLATVHRSLTDVRQLREQDDLDGEDVVPGFRCRLADILVP